MLRVLGIIFGALLAAAAIALLIYTFIMYEQLGFTKGAIMEAVAVVALLAGVTTAVLSERLL